LSTKISGYVEEKIEYPAKPGNNKWGKPNEPSYALKVDGIKYGGMFGRKMEPKCKNGDYVEFEAEQNGSYWNLVANTLQPATAPAAALPPVQAEPAKAAGNTKAAWVPDKDRQDSIIYQSSRNAAIEFVNGLVSAQLLDFGKAKGAQKIELVEILMDEYTMRFYEDTKRLAPVPHKSPVDATFSENAADARKPAAKRAVAEPAKAQEPDDFEDTDIPFN
jgi:hypothetical protein